MLTSDNGIITKVNEEKLQTEIAQLKEALEMFKTEKD